MNGVTRGALECCVYLVALVLLLAGVLSRGRNAPAGAVEGEKDPAVFATICVFLFVPLLGPHPPPSSSNRSSSIP
jgi:hypothetical protein